MTTFKEMCGGKMSAAVKAMLAGLEEQDRRDDFVVDMDEWLFVDGDFCGGCAASCAIQELTGKRYDLDDLRAFARHDDLIGLPERVLLADAEDAEDLFEFESAINEIRDFYAERLAAYMGVRREYARACADDPSLSAMTLSASLPQGEEFRWMTTKNWRTFVPALREWAERLEKAGF